MAKELKKATKKNQDTKKIVKHNLFDDIITITTIVEESIEQKVNWKKIPIGTKIKCTIGGTEVNGRIFKEDEEISICQDLMEGNICANKLGYNYSWSIENGTPENLKDNEVKIISLEIDKTFKIPDAQELIFIDEKAVQFAKKSIKVGCTTVPIEKVRRIIELHDKQFATKK